MKKLISVIIAAAVVISSFTAVLGDDEITVLLDGEKLEFDVQPQIINDRTMVPMRVIFEALGADVEWDGSTKSITSQKDETVIIMTIGYDTMFLNYSPVTLDSPPVIVDDRTLVPLRAVAESFNCAVDWENATRTVTILTAPLATETPQQSASPSTSPSASPASSDKAGASASPQPASATDDPDATANPESTASPNVTADPSATADPGATASPEASADAEATEAPETSPTTAPTPAPTATPAAASYNTGDDDGVTCRFDAIINYDDTNEKASSSIKNFNITSIILNSNGKFDITYTLQTYNDSTAKVIPKFKCYDSEGKLVDRFTEIFTTWAYSWTEQDGAATISGDTVLIELEEE